METVVPQDCLGLLKKIQEEVNKSFQSDNYVKIVNDTTVIPSLEEISTQIKEIVDGMKQEHLQDLYQMKITKRKHLDCYIYYVLSEKLKDFVQAMNSFKTDKFAFLKHVRVGLTLFQGLFPGCLEHHLSQVNDEIPSPHIHILTMIWLNIHGIEENDQDMERLVNISNGAILFEKTTFENNRIFEKAHILLRSIFKERLVSKKILKAYSHFNIHEKDLPTEAKDLPDFSNDKEKRDSLCEEMLKLIPNYVIALNFASPFWGVTLQDGGIGINGNLLKITASRDEQDLTAQDDQEEIKTAMLVLVILHELAHKKRLLTQVNGCYFKLTQELFKKEAENYWQQSVFSIAKLQPHIGSLTKELAQRVLDKNFWKNEEENFNKFTKDLVTISSSKKDLVQEGKDKSGLKKGFSLAEGDERVMCGRELLQRGLIFREK